MKNNAPFRAANKIDVSFCNRIKFAVVNTKTSVSIFCASKPPAKPKVSGSLEKVLVQKIRLPVVGFVAFSLVIVDMVE